MIMAYDKKPCCFFVMGHMYPTITEHYIKRNDHPSLNIELVRFLAREGQFDCIDIVLKNINLDFSPIKNKLFSTILCSDTPLSTLYIFYKHGYGYLCDDEIYNDRVEKLDRMLKNRAQKKIYFWIIPRLYRPGSESAKRLAQKSWDNVCCMQRMFYDEE